MSGPVDRGVDSSEQASPGTTSGGGFDAHCLQADLDLYRSITAYRADQSDSDSTINANNTSDDAPETSPFVFVSAIIPDSGQSPGSPTQSLQMRVSEISTLFFHAQYSPDGSQGYVDDIANRLTAIVNDQQPFLSGQANIDPEQSSGRSNFQNNVPEQGN